MVAEVLAVALSTAAAPPPVAPTFEQEARLHLKEMVRRDTSNPPGNEIVVARYIKAQLDAESIPSEIIESTPTRASLIALLKGNGSRKPLVLMCHTDVVPADPKEWETDPFEAVEKDGFLYGRGTADIKSMCATQLAIVTWLKRERVKLARDVIFFAEADEENGGPVRHLPWLLAKYGKKVDAEFAINEGGNTLWREGQVSEIRVQAAEKEYMDFTLTARGQAGHASVPRGDNAVASLARAVARLNEHRPSAQINGVVRGFLERQAETAPVPLQEAINNVLLADPGPDLDSAADRLAALNPEFGAMLRDTITPTMLKAGYKSNVIPAEAEAVFNARLMPGRAPADLIAELKAVVDDPSVEFKYDPPTRDPVPAMSTATVLYTAAVEAAAEFAPQARVMPFMAAWTTDSQDLRARGITVYGIDPPLSEEDGERVHGKNERISLAALDWYSRYLRGIVVRLAAVEAPQGAKGTR